MKLYYAIGNLGAGSLVFAFSKKSERDKFVSFGKADNSAKITAKDAYKRLGRNKTYPVEIEVWNTGERVSL